MKSLRKIQAEGLAMMRAGLNKMTPDSVGKIALVQKLPRRLNGKLRKRRLPILFERQGGCCHLCGEMMTMAKRGDKLRPRDANIDHYIPRAMGGPNSMNNLRAAHYECNSLKGGKFYQSQEPEPDEPLPPKDGG